MSLENFLPLAIVLVFVLIGFAVSVYQNKRRKEMLSLQAEKRNGELSKHGWLGRWELRLPYKGNTVVIYSVPGSRYNPPKTLATMKSDTAILPAIDIVRNTLAQKVIEKFGKERTLTNDEEFDRQCVIRCDDQFVAQRMLTADLKQRLTDRSLRSLEVRVNPQEFKVMMLSIPSSDETYDNFIDTVFAILQKVR